MQCQINHKKEYDSALLFTIDKLPKDFGNELLSFLKQQQIYTVNEIRINSFCCVSLIVNQNIIKTSIATSRETIEKIILSLCDDSIYAHLNTIKEGYISVGKGIRAGICGKAVISNGQVEGIYDITSVNIRIPQRIRNASERIFNYLKERSFLCSAILYSPPGVGKTTVLRDLISHLSDEQIRCAVIDSREEITPILNDAISADIFLSYPKDVAIEIATKSMTPQIIVCDEITSLKEAEAIKYSVNTGVSIIATTHAGSFEELLSKQMIKPLFDCNAFNVAIGIKRNLSNRFIYEFNELL